MAFTDLPIIDPPSVNSESSERALISFMNQASGFICRPDKPDKGCDFDTELIVEGKSAANRRFGIQLKSVEHLPLIAGGIISYPFETSRLGYLLNRPIGEGLIILYDVDGGGLYYEYAVTLYHRLMKEKGSDDWQQQDNVNVHIPKNNLLNEKAATDIHAHFRDRFEKAAFLLASQGPRYGVPTAGPTSDNRIDIRNPEQVRDLLLRHGMSMLQGHDLDLCYQLLRQLPATEIEAYPELMVLAAISYGELGRRYDSENFIRKLNKRDQVPAGQKQMITFCHLKNQLMLDQIGMEQFIAGAMAIREAENSDLNILLLDLNIIFYKLLSVKFYHGLPQDVLSRIRSVFDQIAALGIDKRSQWLMEVNNAENFAQYVGFLRTSFLNDLAIHRALKIKGRSPQLEILQTEYGNLENELNEILRQLYDNGQSTRDPLLQGHALLVRCRYVMAKEMDLYAQWPILKDVRFHDETIYVQNIQLAFLGNDHFMEAGYPALAHQCLCCGIELILIGRQVYQYNDCMDLDELTKRRQLMEQDNEIEPEEPQFPVFANRIQKIYNTADSGYMYDTKEMDDRQLAGMAASISRAFGLPPDCYNNLLNELKNCRLFYLRSKKDLELIPYDRKHDQRVLYQKAVLFTIYNKRTEVMSAPTSDVGTMLDNWGL